jgi:hypothetical protein
MCNIVVINRGEKELGTPRQFQEHFGFLPNRDIHYTDIDMESCLCQCDIEASFKERDIPYLFDGDYYVGELDRIKLPNA